MLLKSEDKGFINQASYLYFLISFGNKIKSLIKNEHIYLIEDYEIFINHNSEKISYSFNENKIINFNLDKDNKVLNLINSYFNDIVKTHEYVFLHEVGHAVQHSSITQYNPTNDKNYKPVVYYNTKTKQELYYLTPLLSNIKKPEQIAQFIYSNLQESYADIYAAYTMYLKNNTTSHINDIIQFRTQELNKIKNINSEKVTPYQNIQALNIFRQEINKAMCNLRLEMQFIKMVLKSIKK